jgi:hypothetical protein
MTTVHVICCNDSLEFAVVGAGEEAESEAKTRMAALREEYFQRNRWNFRSEDHYATVCFWHIHTVEGLNMETAPKTEDSAPDKQVPK